MRKLFLCIVAGKVAIRNELRSLRLGGPTENRQQNQINCNAKLGQYPRAWPRITP